VFSTADYLNGFDIEFPGKDNIVGVGESVEVQEKEHRVFGYESTIKGQNT
jgi:hypothetical protein